MQVFGLDYFGTYAPVARSATLRILYALAVLLQLELTSMDVEAAFMNAALKEELCINALPGTELYCNFIKLGQQVHSTLPRLSLLTRRVQQ